MEEGREGQRALQRGYGEEEGGRRAWGDPEGEGSLGRKLRLERGLAPLPRGCDGDDANRAQEQKSGCDSNRRCQGTAPRLGAASGPWDRRGEAGMQKLLHLQKKRKIARCLERGQVVGVSAA